MKTGTVVIVVGGRLLCSKDFLLKYTPAMFILAYFAYTLSLRMNNRRSQ